MVTISFDAGRSLAVRPSMQAAAESSKLEAKGSASWLYLILVAKYATRGSTANLQPLRKI